MSILLSLGRSKSKFVNQHEAAFLLAYKTGLIKKGWLFVLSDNRRSRALNELGIIPFFKVGTYVYYARTDIEAVAHALNMDRATLCGLPKLFP